MKVLIVEDDPITQSLLARAFEARGHTTFLACSSEEAIGLLQQDTFPLIFLDLGLPGMNGLELGRYVRRELPFGESIYIIVGTSMLIDDKEFSLSNILATADDYLPKPFHPDLLSVRLTIAEKKVGELANRREQDASLKGERDFLSALIEASNALIIVIDNDQQVVSMNQWCSQMTGFDSNASVKFPDSFSVPEQWPEVQAKLAELRKTFFPVGFETLLRNSRGEEYFVLWTASLASIENTSEIVCSGVDITEQYCNMERLKSMVVRDPLTQLLNRNCLSTAIQDLHRHAQMGISCALLEVDLDGLKVINDELGLATGDSLLLGVAGILNEKAGPDHLVLRSGGDEFLLFLTGATASEAERLAEQIRVSVADFSFVERPDLSITTSIGIVMVDSETNAEVIVARANQACHLAKTHGRNRTEVYRNKGGRTHFNTGTLIRKSEVAAKNATPFQRVSPPVDLAVHTDIIRRLVSMGFTGAAITKVLNEQLYANVTLGAVQRFIAVKNLRAMIGHS